MTDGEFQMRFEVANYQTWRGVFDSNEGFRRACGWTGGGPMIVVGACKGAGLTTVHEVLKRSGRQLKFP